MPDYSRYVAPKETPPEAPPEKRPLRAKPKKTTKGVKDDAE